MYLLNPDDVTLFVFDEVFTFHYVSIKSIVTWDQSYIKENLHSTMYLLNRIYVVNTTTGTAIFTFHYVSIKS